MGKDIGWQYLNSDEQNDDFNSDDGSWSYQNDDGSGSYYGADGSWGYKNADGSASYYGADGSWGYKNADGSSSYYGADGSWGYKNEDGSGSYYPSDDSDDDCEYYDSNESDNYSSYDSGDSEYGGVGLAAGLAGIALGLGALAYSRNRNRNDEDDEDYEEHYREVERIEQEKALAKEKEKALRKKRIKAFFFNKKQLQMDFSTGELIGENVNEVMTRLADVGFNNVKVVSIKDIYVGSDKTVGEVEQVVIGGQSWLDVNSLVPYDAEIIVTYHLKKELTFPYSAHQVVNKNYQSLVNELYGFGFTEVYTREINDLKTGWITKDGSVKQVFIGEENNYKKGRVFAYDVKIVIEYHTFAKKK